jgi:hypothetical protein
MKITQHHLRQLIREMLDTSVFDELGTLVQADQRLRKEWENAVNAEGGFKVLRHGTPRWDAVRSEFMRAHGTTDDDMFGDKSRAAQILSLPDRLDWDSMTEDDWHNIALLTQHMDGAPAFQKRMLTIFRKWRGEGSSQYQYLHDRISCRETGTQLFGTQDAGTNYTNCKWVRD